MKAARFVPSPFLALFTLVIFGLAGSAATARAQTATVTVLQQSSSCPASGCITTLTATVTAGATAVHPGLVVFCDGASTNCENSAPIGSAQLIANGTATIKVTLSSGAHTLHAIFHGTKTYSRSESSPQSATVTPTAAERNSVTNITAIGSDGGYTLSGTVSGVGPRSPAGSVSFLDTSNDNALVDSAPLGTGVTSLSYASGGLDLSNVPASIYENALNAATGDFNNDGYQDVAETDFTTTHLNVLLGNGKGSFTAAPAYSGNTGAHGAFLVADFNSDGKLDVAIPDYNTNTVHVSLGNGDGTFTSAPATTLSGSPEALYFGDFNGDGIPDLIAVSHVSSGGDVILPLVGKGDGTFTPQAPVMVGTDPLGPLAVADFNHDGIQDLAVVDNNTASISIFKGIGDGTFAAQPVTISFRGLHLAAGDFDGDGIPDLVTDNFGVLTFLHGNGDNTFTMGSTQPALSGYANFTALTTGDFNGDGVLDVAGQIQFNDTDTNPTTIQTYLNNGAGVFSAAGDLAAFYNGPVLAMADFTSDGIPDAIIFNTPIVEPPSTFTGALVTTATAVSAPGLLLPGAGTHNIVAGFPGDSYYNASASTPLALLGTSINYPAGFAGASSIVLNGSASLQGSAIELTDGKQFEAGGFFNSMRQPVAAFSTDFDFQLTDATADGFAFVIQNNGPDALGSGGGGLGYGNPPNETGPGIPYSYAIAFDLHNNQGEGDNSVRVEYNGVTSAKFFPYFDSTPTDLTPSGINLHSGHRFHATITFNGSSLFLTIKDLQTNAVFSQELPSPGAHSIISSSYIAGSTAYVGFTGGTGAGTAVETIYNWTFTPMNGAPPQYPSPTFPNGFAGAAGLHFNGGAAISGSAIDLTNGTTFEAPSVYFTSQITPANNPYSFSFSTDFDFQIENGIGDGFTFVFQDQGLNAQGSSGGGLGYGPDHPNGAGAKIADSLAIKFDLHNNAGEGVNSTGLYFNGASPTTPSIDLTPSGINLHSGHTFHAHISLGGGNGSDGGTLTITDLNEYRVFSTTLQISPTLFPSSGYAGFTAGTGATPSSIKILNWTWTEQ